MTTPFNEDEDYKDYTGLSPEDLEIFLRLPVTKEFRKQLYETLKNAPTQDRHSGICSTSDEKNETVDATDAKGGG